MKTKIYISFIAVIAAFVSCSPRVDNIFENSAIERLDRATQTNRELLISKPNGWVLQYFPQTGASSSDSAKHMGYTFLMDFSEDGSVIVGAPVDGMFKTESSIWDVISDNSTVLTFNTFNHIFHYFSNPDPDLGLWGADGEGFGGDYEFLILDYATTKGRLTVKGKKRGTYNYMYALADDESWPGYFNKLHKMDSTLLSGLDNNTPLDFYINEDRLTLFNAPTHEFRAFRHLDDTLGGGMYYGFLVTPRGIRIHDDEILEHQIGHTEFVLNEAGDKLVAESNPNMYITMDGVDAFLSSLSAKRAWKADIDAFSDTRKTNIQKIIEGIVSDTRYSAATVDELIFAGNGSNGLILTIKWSLTQNGKVNPMTDTYEYVYSNDGNKVTISAHAQATTKMKNMDFYKKAKTTEGKNNVQALLESFMGSFDIEMLHGFAPKKGIRLKNDDAAKTFILKQ